MTISKKAKIAAVIAATQAKFKPRVEELEKRLNDHAVSHFEGVMENCAAAEWYKQIPQAYKVKTTHTSVGNLRYINDNGVNEKFPILVHLHWKPSGACDNYAPLHKNKSHMIHTVSFIDPKIIMVDPLLDDSKTRALVSERKQLITEIRKFMDKLHEALIPLSTERKVLDGLPTIHPFFKFPSKGTSMVSKHLMDDINSAMANV